MEVDRGCGVCVWGGGGGKVTIGAFFPGRVFVCVCVGGGGGGYTKNYNRHLYNDSA